MKTRYYESPWIVRVWRHIHWLRYPVLVCRLVYGGMPPSCAKSLSKGLIQSYMGLTYTLQEWDEHRKPRINIRDK